MADTITINMPGKGDEKIIPATLFVLREALPFEKEENPEVICCAWGANFRVFPAETLAQLAVKFATLKLVRLTAPGGAVLIVSAERITDRDEPIAVLDHENTRSVLCFGPGATTPRIRVRENKLDLQRLWEKSGLPVTALD